MKSVDISGTPRTGLGKKHARAARREGMVPCVIYGGDQVVHFTAHPNDVKPVVYTPEFKQANISVDGKSYRCILKDSQFHPVTDNLLHLDFLQLIEGKSVKVNIPVRCDGPAAGVKEGGRLNQKIRRVTVKTTPDKLVEELVVDVKELVLGQSVRVKDIPIKEGMEVMSAPNSPIASVETPRALRSAEAEAEAEGLEGEAAEGAEGAEGATPAEGETKSEG